MICLFVSAKFTNVTDTHTDRHTDIAYDIGRACVASRGKNMYAFALVHVIIQNVRA